MAVFEMNDGKGERVQPTSPKNQQRWSRLEASEDFVAVRELVRAVVDAAGVDMSDLGDTWGITVGTDTNTFLRVNCGDYALFDIREPQAPLQEREVCIAALFERGKMPSMTSRVKWKAKGLDVSAQPGFVKKIEGSVVLFTTVGAVMTLLADPEFHAAVRRHALARPRRMPTEHYHNPLTSGFFS